jgi:DNA repair protein RadB
LGGGFPINGLTLVYGEAESGKTSLAIQSAVSCARTGKKALFIDTEGTFTTNRLSQIASRDYDAVAPRIMVITPDTFQEQAKAIDALEMYMTKSIRLLVIDTVTTLYRVELETPETTFNLNRELNRQIAVLTQVVKTHTVAALITSQVRTRFQEKRAIEPVAMRVLRFWSDVVLNLRRTDPTRVVTVLQEKPAPRQAPASCYVRIMRTGIQDHRV